MRQLEGPALPFKIEKIDHVTDFDVCGRNYRNCIINTLIQLKCKNIFEIGSYLFQTATAVSYYLEKYMSDGHLITADISKHGNRQLPSRTTQVMFYPYEEPYTEHGKIEVYYSNWEEVIKHDLALELNSLKLLDEMIANNVKNFDLAFVDGSHSSTSFLSDLYLAQLTTRKDGWILIDDIYEQKYSQYQVYQRLKLKNLFYEYENYNGTRPGFALIQNKDLTV